MKLPVMNKAQKRLVWIVFYFDVAAFIGSFLGQWNCNMSLDSYLINKCDYTGWFSFFIIVGVILLFWLLGQPKQQK
jgi:hypothetical protein